MTQTATEVDYHLSNNDTEFVRILLHGRPVDSALDYFDVVGVSAGPARWGTPSGQARHRHGMEQLLGELLGRRGESVAEHLTAFVDDLHPGDLRTVDTSGRTLRLQQVPTPQDMLLNGGFLHVYGGGRSAEDPGRPALPGLRVSLNLHPWAVPEATAQILQMYASRGLAPSVKSWLHGEHVSTRTDPCVLRISYSQELSAVLDVMRAMPHLIDRTPPLLGTLIAPGVVITQNPKRGGTFNQHRIDVAKDIFAGTYRRFTRANPAGHDIGDAQALAQVRAYLDAHPEALTMLVRAFRADAQTAAPAFGISSRDFSYSASAAESANDVGAQTRTRGKPLAPSTPAPGVGVRRVYASNISNANAPGKATS